MRQTKLFGANEETPVYSQLNFEEAKILALEVENLVKPLCSKLKVVGSIRREKQIIGDIDFIAISSNWSDITRIFKKNQILSSGENVIKANFPCKNGFFQVDFYRATQQTWGIQKLIRTGSADHNVWLAGYAISKGFKLKYNEGLLKGNLVVAGETEESIFTALGLSCPKPTHREIVDTKPIWLQA